MIISKNFLSILLLCYHPSNSFLIKNTPYYYQTTTTKPKPKPNYINTKLFGSTTTNLPSWENMEHKLQLPNLNIDSPYNIIDSTINPTTKPNFSTTKPTLYRERHGWCPYSERVWLAFEIKNILYDTILIENSGYGSRPSYYSGSTPQVMWEDGDVQSESMDLVREIDKRYDGNGNVELYPKDIENEVINKIRAFNTIFPSRTRPSSRAAFLFRYDGEPLWKKEFESVLRQTNDLLSETSTSTSTAQNNGGGGPFFCGDRITAADVAWAPFLERYAAQLPCFHDDFHFRYDRTTYPYLVDWHDAMETLVPSYVCRVKGDSSSWRKVLRMAGYGNGGCSVPTDVSDRMEDIEQMEISDGSGLGSGPESESEQHVWNEYVSSRPWVASTPGKEAASVMIKNREAILKDITKRVDKHSDLANYTKEDIEEAMRVMVCLLCQEEEEEEDGIEDYKDYAHAVTALATYLDERMCVPRDMGCLSAATIKRLISRMTQM